MRFEKLLVLLTALFFLVYGVLFALFPDGMAGLVTGSTPQTASGMIDLRATYGGMSIAVGVLMIRLAAKEETLKFGLLSVVVVLLSMAITRLIGFAIDGNPNTLMVVYLIAEVLPAIAAGLFYRRMSVRD